MINEKDFTEIVRNIRCRTSRMEREGDYWSEAEKDQLIRLFDSSVGITQIAVQLQRTEPAVIQQIEKLDLYHRKDCPKRRRRNRRTPLCLCDACKADAVSCPRNQAYRNCQEER